MPCRSDWRESFLIRLWSEHDRDQSILRGFIQNVQTGHKTYFHDLDLPLDLLRESARRIDIDHDSRPPATLR